MPSPIIKGTSGIIEKHYEVSFDPRRGIQVRRRYTQAGGASGLEPVELQARAQGYTTRKLVSPVLSELEIISPELPSDGSGGSVEDVVYDTWQIVGSDIMESAFTSPTLMAQVGPVDRRVISEAVRNGLPPNSNPAVVGDGSGGVGAALQLYREILKGQDSYYSAQYILRHTTNVSENSTYNVSDENVLCIYTTAQLLAEITSTSLWVKPCPTRLVTKISGIPVDSVPGDEGSYYVWGWLKKPSTETTGANNRVDINTDYVLYNWSTLRYLEAA